MEVCILLCVELFFDFFLIWQLVKSVNITCPQTIKLFLNIYVDLEFTIIFLG